MRTITVLQLVAMGLPVVGYGMAWWMQPKRRARRALDRAAPRFLGDVRHLEDARITGVARRLRETLVSPVTGRSCLGDRFVIEERGSEGWSVGAHGWRCVPFDPA